MPSSFLFTATDSNGKKVTDRVESENLATAKYKLELQGYSYIEFYESELSNDVQNLFSDRQIKELKKQPASRQVELQYKTAWWHTAAMALKLTAIGWLPLLIWAVWTGATTPIIALALFGGFIIYCLMPVVIYHYFINGHFWANNSQVRLWGTIATLFNYVSINKIPQFEIDTRIACVDAREGNLNKALQLLAKYRNNEKVSKRLFNNALTSIYSSAKKYDEVLKTREKSLQDGNDFPEELLDYAVTLALHHQKTSQARVIVDRVLDMELNLLTTIFLPFCQGIIETEDDNITKAEFYLREAEKRVEPFKKNSQLDGIRYLIKAFLSISLGKKGEKTEGQQLFKEAKPYLVAQKENEILQRCEEALS